jgi:adenosine deaminase
MAHEYATTSNKAASDVVQAGITKLQNGVVLDEIYDFFNLFPAIYALTSSPDTLRRATRAVMAQFLDGPFPQCEYLELRSTPRETAGMSRVDYVRTVLDEVERYPQSRAALIVSLDRRMGSDVLRECVGIACALREGGRRVVGVDLCGDPQVSYLPLSCVVLNRNLLGRRYGHVCRIFRCDQTCRSGHNFAHCRGSRLL